MILDILKLAAEKVVGAKVKENIVDIQLAKCYKDVLMDVRFKSYGYFDADEDITSETYKKIYEDAKISGGYISSIFDSYGNPEKMYISMCIFANRILTRQEYRIYADRIVKKMVAYPELSAYVNIPVFKERIMEEFDINKVRFPKDVPLIYNNYDALVRYLDRCFDISGFDIIYDLQPGTHAITEEMSRNLKFSGKLFPYVCDAGQTIKRLPGENIRFDFKKESKTIYITTTEDRCTLLLGNSKLEKREK